MDLPKKIHVIGICCVAMSAVAVAFHKRGVAVTGSDKGFFPPVSIELEKQGIPFYAGWHPEKLAAAGPDLVMIGTASGRQNPETVYAREHSIPSYSYPEIIGKYFSGKRSVVCAGTWGKTSSAALLSFILDYAGLDPSYMFGGISLSHESSARLADSKWSVFEGDEYKSSPDDPRPKFFHYKPTDLLLSAVSWDHADLYPTQEKYFEVFEKLLEMIQDGGTVVACADNRGVMDATNRYDGKIILYGRIRPEEAPGRPVDFAYSDVSQSSRGLKFSIRHDGLNHVLRSPMLGLYQVENITGCFAMARQLGIGPDKIVEAVSAFKGLKRRLERRLDGRRSAGGITVMDDIAHSPEKAYSVLSTLRSIYDGKIIAVFEPNSGGRERRSAVKYGNAFRDADAVIIPRLTKLKIAAENPELPVEGGELATIIGATHPDTRYLADDQALVDFLSSTAKKDDVIVFLGSHGFRGMIEEVIKRVR